MNITIHKSLLIFIAIQKSLFTVIGKFLLLDILMHLVQKTYQLLSPIIIPESYPDCPVAVKNNSLQGLIDLHDPFLHYSRIYIFYYELLLHLSTLLVEN
jgi:hypothetical protein